MVFVGEGKKTLRLVLAPEQHLVLVASKLSELQSRTERNPSLVHCEVQDRLDHRAFLVDGGILKTFEFFLLLEAAEELGREFIHRELAVGGEEFGKEPLHAFQVAGRMTKLRISQPEIGLLVEMSVLKFRRRERILAGLFAFVLQLIDKPFGVDFSVEAARLILRTAAAFTESRLPFCLAGFRRDLSNHASFFLLFPSGFKSEIGRTGLVR